jgi:hypothetical protein
MTKLAKHPGGRPTDYSDKLVEHLCEKISSGMSVRRICEKEDMPSEDTFYKWLAKYPKFSEKYTQAVRHRTDKYLEECVDLADTMPDGVAFLGTDGRLYERDEVMALQVRERAELGLVAIALTPELINKRKLQIETRMKAAARMHPRKYGDKVQTEVTGKDGGPVESQVTIYMPANGR